MEILVTTWETLAFYREDYLIAFVALPIFIFTGVSLVATKYRMWIVSLLAMLFSALTYVQVTAYFDMGGFLSIQMLKEGARWVTAHPEDFDTYLSPGIQTLFVGACLMFMITALLASRPVYAAWDRAGQVFQKLVCGFAALVICGFGILTWTVHLPSSPMQRSAYHYMLDALAPNSSGGATRFDSLPPAELRTAYQDATGAPERKDDSEFWGSARDYNVVYFVLETIPHNLLDLTANLALTPCFDELHQKSFVAAQHYTTSTLSNRALFSLFGSLYPPATGSVIDGPGRKAPTILWQLRRRGYHTAAYFPTKLLGWEYWMFEALGFEDVTVAQTIVEPPPLAEDWRLRKWFDEFALEDLKRDIREWVRDDRRFAAAFLPQTGHAPWPNLLEDGIDKDVQTRGLEVVALHDQWLSEIVDLLGELGAVERTLIVLTADHGIRHWAEDPSFAAGRPGDSSFHVPMMIYAPGVVESTKTIDWATSHIDVAPTLASLLGIAEGRELEQGGAIWDTELASRTIYFWAHLVETVRGYRSPEHYALWNGVIETVHVNVLQQFDSPNQVPQTSTLYESVRTDVTTLEDIQRAWLANAIR